MDKEIQPTGGGYQETPHVPLASPTFRDSGMTFAQWLFGQALSGCCASISPDEEGALAAVDMAMDALLYAQKHYPHLFVDQQKEGCFLQHYLKEFSKK